MSSAGAAVADEAVAGVLTRLRTVVDDLATLPLDGVCDFDVLEVWRQLETANRRLASVDHAVIGQVRDRRLDFEHGATSVQALARLVLRVPIREAAARVRAAAAAGPQQNLIGESLPPVYGQVAAAQAAGAISPAHARIIVDTIDRVPGAVQKQHGEASEAFLVEQARELDPDAVAIIARHLAVTLDPDGAEPDDERDQARRELRMSRHRNRPGGRITGELTGELYEHLRTVLDSLNEPTPATVADDSTVLARDVRSAAQRDHDALLDLTTHAERAGQLPDAGGITTTVVLTSDANDWADGRGLVRTGHGQLIPTRDAWRWTSANTRYLHVGLTTDHDRTSSGSQSESAGPAGGFGAPISERLGELINRAGAIAAYTDCRRYFTELQRLAMIARDGGCAFPACDRPPQYTEAHHVIEHQHGGRTEVDNGCLLCRYHHRLFVQMGWTAVMINGIPHFIPPKVIDHEQRPLRNTAHNPEAHLTPV